MINDFLETFGTDQYFGASEVLKNSLGVALKDSGEECLRALDKHVDRLEDIDQKFCHLIATLERTNEDLLQLESSMMVALDDVSIVQQSTKDKSSKIEHHKKFAAALDKYIDSVAIPRELDAAIKTEDVTSDAFRMALRTLSEKIAHADEEGLKAFPSSHEMRRTLYDLLAVAGTRSREYILTKLKFYFGQPQRTQLQTRQSAFKTQTEDCMNYLNSRSQFGAVASITKAYQQYLAVIHYEEAQGFFNGLDRAPRYTKRITELRLIFASMGYDLTLLRTQEAITAGGSTAGGAPSGVEWLNNLMKPRSLHGNSRLDSSTPATSNSTILGVEALFCPPEKFAERVKILANWDNNALPIHLHSSGNRDFPAYPAEEILRSGLKAFVNAALEEYKFIMTYFFSDTIGAPHMDQSDLVLPSCSSTDKDSDGIRRGSVSSRSEGADSLSSLGTARLTGRDLQAKGIFDQIFSRSMGLVRQKLESVISVEGELCSLVLMWRLLDRFSVYSRKATEGTSLSNFGICESLLLHLSHAVWKNIIEITSMVTNVNKCYISLVERKSASLLSGSNTYDRAGIDPPDPFLMKFVPATCFPLLADSLVILATAFGASSDWVYQQHLAIRVLTDLRTSMESYVQTIEGVTRRVDSDKIHLRDRLRLLSDLQYLGKALERRSGHSDCGTAEFEVLMTGINDWWYNKHAEILELVCDIVLKRVAGSVQSFLRNREGSNVEFSDQCQEEAVKILKADRGWRNAVANIQSICKEAAEFVEDESLVKEVTTTALTRFLTLHSRFSRVLQEIPEEQRSDQLSEELRGLDQVTRTLIDDVRKLRVYDSRDTPSPREGSSSAAPDAMRIE